MGAMDENGQGMSGVVLLMDDEESIRTVSQRALTRYGYRLYLASKGEEALAIYKRQMQTAELIDVVILDITIAGGMGGGETMKLLRELDPQVTAIVSSGYSNDPMMMQPEEHGFVRAIVKPYRMADLHQEIQKILATKRNNLL
ncbi:response regulator [bacterium AH-315-J21]|nr:response regulator [bacterium AH-315-J21]